MISWASQVVQRESYSNAEDTSSIPGWRRSPGGGHGNPLQYSCLENSHGQRSLAGYSSWGRQELDTTDQSSTAQHMISYVEQFFIYLYIFLKKKEKAENRLYSKTDLKDAVKEKDTSHYWGICFSPFLSFPSPRQVLQPSFHQLCSKPLAHKNLASLFFPRGPLKSSEPGSKKGYNACDCCGSTGSQAGAHWHFQEGPPCRAVHCMPAVHRDGWVNKISKDQTWHQKPPCIPWKEPT